MSITKHKIFKLPLSDDGEFSIPSKVESILNTFLSEPNIVYVNHSISTLTVDAEEYGNMKTKCKFILLSLIYKDLASSSLDVKYASKKAKSIVHKQVENGEEIKEPIIKTEIDEEIQQLTMKHKL